MSNGKVMIVHLIVALIKKTLSNACIKVSWYFPNLYQPFGGDINVKVDLPNYATKTGIKMFRRLILHVLD